MPESIFCDALEFAPEEREAFLAKVCGSNPGILAEVKELLAAHDCSDAFFGADNAAGEGGEVTARATAAEFNRLKPEEAGDRIGPYRLLEQIGEGGFGTVWMAEQEKPIRRRVALKIIKLGMDTKQVVARFEQERQALAIMDHPNIARVLDAGVTSSGRSYFAMELVVGCRITQYCDEAQLGICERLKLFLEVCSAVQHAHQKGIVHRDLKPSNVLVTLQDGKPVPKVIDFGIAKALCHQAEPLTNLTVFTHGEQIIGSPLYMAPEQAGGNAADIDTRADIYSSGVVLYELLTGQPPFADQLWQATFEEVTRKIREQVPPRPSMVLNALSLAEGIARAASRSADPRKLQRGRYR